MVQTVLPYHCVMTPKWIHNNAVITGPHTLYSQYLEILPTTGVQHQRALRIQLVAPNILTSTDSVTVTVTVSMDVTLANSIDHDPIFGISDGESFIGFMVRDRDYYSLFSPCHKIEGKVVQTALKNVRYGSGPLVSSNSRTYSSEVKIQIKAAEKWGSCYSEHDGGHVNIQDYQASLDSTNALYLELYHEDAPEKYRIKYMVVDIDFD